MKIVSAAYIASLKRLYIQFRILSFDFLLIIHSSSYCDTWEVFWSFDKLISQGKEFIYFLKNLSEKHVYSAKPYFNIHVHVLHNKSKNKSFSECCCFILIQLKGIQKFMQTCTRYMTIDYILINIPGTIHVSKLASRLYKTDYRLYIYQVISNTSDNLNLNI